MKAAGIVAMSNGSILLIRRADSNTWCFPGGMQEGEESLEDCARREFKEETGFDVGEITLVGRSVFDNVEFSTFLAKTNAFVPVLAINEHNDWKWQLLNQEIKDLYPPAREVLTKHFKCKVSDACSFEDTSFFDETNLRVVSGGYLVAQPKVSRSGIQEYAGEEVGMPEKSIVKVYRPVDEVFHKDSMASLANRPITLDHPPVFVDAKNWKEYAIGNSSGEVLRDGDFIRIPMMIMDQKAIEDIKSGKCQISVGYDANLSFEPGITEAGEHYDAIQRTIRANHIAIVDRARGGPKLRLGDHKPKERVMADKIVLIDGVKLTLPDTEATVLENRLSQLDKKINDLTTQNTQMSEDIKAKDAELAALRATVTDKDAELKKQADSNKITPQMISDAVNECLTVADKGTQLIGDKLITVNKLPSEMRRQVVTERMGDACKDFNDDQIKVAFDTLASTMTSSQGFSLKDVANQFRQPVHQFSKEKADYDKRLSDAWKAGK